MIKKSNRLFLIFVLISTVLLINTGCKEFGIPEYSFIVTLGEGVSGSPEAGTYTYKELSDVNYEYIFTNEAERSPGVFVNDSSSPNPSKGSIIMYRDIEIFVGDVDFRGNWALTVADPNGVETASSVVFSGDTFLEGTFSDTSDSGYEGTWISVNNVVNMTYVNRGDYRLSGNVSPKFIVGNAFSGEKSIGTWSMVKE